YMEYRFCYQGPYCLGGFGWINASSELYVQPYGSIRRNRPCERRGGCAGESTPLGPGADIKTSDQLCPVCK
ncbi:hypothetical protein QBC32DRAFT_183390, partial [Pseudoneurospora amorphoporcata]